MNERPRTPGARPPGGALRRVLAAYALFGVVELAVWVAVILVAYDRGGPSLAATASVVQLVPAAVLASPLAGIGARLSPGAAVASAHAAVAVTTGLTAGSILSAAPTIVVIGASATATTTMAVVRPLHFAALPRLARTPESLVSANATSSMADGFALFAGPTLAGVGAATAGPWLVLVASAAAAGAAALLCVRLTPVAATTVQASPGWRAAYRSLHVVRRDARLLALTLVMSTQFLIGGALDVLAVAYSERVLSRAQAEAGLLVGSLGIGAVVGAMAAGRLTRGRRLTPVVVLGGVVQGLAVALVAALDSTAAAVGAIALTGAGGALLTVAGRTLIQNAVDDGLLAGLFAVLESAALLGFAAGAAVAPGLIAMFSPAGAFVPLGLASAAVTVGTAAVFLRLDLPAAVPESDRAVRA